MPQQHSKMPCRLEQTEFKYKLLTKLHTLDSDAYVTSVIDLIESTPAEDVYYQKSEEAKELGTHPLHSKDGHLVLAGDAAHAFSTSYGQAANFALEDAATLAVPVFVMVTIYKLHWKITVRTDWIVV